MTLFSMTIIKLYHDFLFVFVFLNVKPHQPVRILVVTVVIPPALRASIPLFRLVPAHVIVMVTNPVTMRFSGSIPLSIVRALISLIYLAPSVDS